MTTAPAKRRILVAGTLLAILSGGLIAWGASTVGWPAAFIAVLYLGTTGTSLILRHVRDQAPRGTYRLVVAAPWSLALGLLILGAATNDAHTSRAILVWALMLTIFAASVTGLWYVRGSSGTYTQGGLLR